MYGQTTIPIRDELPDYPDSFRGKRLLGVDAHLFGHYWCGDRIAVFERREELHASEDGATVDVHYRQRAEIPIAEIEGGLSEYVTNVGAYLGRYLGDADPVYADDADEWEWVSSYARDWITSRTSTRTDAAPRGYATASAAQRSGREY